MRLFAVDEEPGRMRPTPPLKLPVGILLYVIREFLNHGRIAGTHVVGEQMLTVPVTVCRLTVTVHIIHLKPQAGGGPVERFVYARHGRECGGASPL